MANLESAQVCSLPLPPIQYINLYTDENVQQNRTPKPPPPLTDSYEMFGSTFNNEEMIISLESQGIKRIIPINCDRRKELKKLNHALFVNFLDMIDLLVKYPDSPRREEKIDDLTLIFVHMHHLLNEFRPHQARETLRVMMELQKEQRIETSANFIRQVDEAKEIVEKAFSNLNLIENDELNEEMEVDVNINKTKTDDEFDYCDIRDRIMCKIIDESFGVR